MIDPKDLASAIKQLRGQRTQRLMAERAGIDPGSWSTYEKGIRTPRSFERLEKMANALGVDVAALLDLVTREYRRRRPSPRLVEAEKVDGALQARRVPPDFEALEQELDSYLASTKKMILFVMRWMKD